jgi:UDP-2-acetamido-3-amino-2,3-dideoxy-glucuronate N-acetyltransferase
MKVKLAIIGIGRWGKNLVREFNKIAEVAIYCHKGEAADRAWLRKNYPKIKSAASCNEIFQDKTIKAVIIATPINTHFSIAYRALKAGKHVFVEKPMTADPRQAEKLVKLAERKKLTLLVGHIFLYHPVFKKLQSLIKNDPPQYGYFHWSKWGSFKENIIWNDACHPISLALKLFGAPKKINLLHKQAVINIPDIAELKLQFSRGKNFLINLNRVSPQKKWFLFLRTGKRAYLWEDDDLYELKPREQNLKILYRFKNHFAPLMNECREFINNIKENKKPKTDGVFGLKVVELISKIISAP